MDRETIQKGTMRPVRLLPYHDALLGDVQDQQKQTSHTGSPPRRASPPPLASHWSHNSLFTPLPLLSSSPLPFSSHEERPPSPGRNAGRLQDIGVVRMMQQRAVLRSTTPFARVVLGLVVGCGLLLFLSRVIPVAATLALLQQRVTTPHGLVYIVLALLSFISAFSLRGLRWRLFLLHVCDIDRLTVIKIFWVAVLLNFLLPMQGGEVGKSLMLKRLKNVPMSRSLPTVAMDKSLDLMPALVIMASVAFLPSISMNAALWVVLGTVSSVLLGIIFTVALLAWSHAAATTFVRTMMGVVPNKMRGKLETFALGFLQSLLEGVRRPKTFGRALLLTSLAVSCDGLFAWCAFQTVGITTMNVAEALFGYATVTLFSILPNPPGQVGSNELADVMVFAGLLHFPRMSVLAMPLLFHPLTALVMITMGLLCLSSLGLSFRTILNMRQE